MLFKEVLYMEITRELGLVQIYTGKGKGKTTASLGLALRAAGHGFRVHMIQFMKGRGYSGELASVQKLAPSFTISQFGRKCPFSEQIKQGYQKCTGCRKCFIKDRTPEKEDIEQVEAALDQAWGFINSNGCDVLILDEIGNALRYGLVRVNQILELINNKPEEMELILTGRGVPDKVIEAADLVTEMVEVTHPYKKSVSSRRGIEY